MKTLNETILATMAACALAGGASFSALAADSTGDTPTLKDLKNSSTRGLVAVPLPTQNSVPPVVVKPSTSDANAATTKIKPQSNSAKSATAKKDGATKATVASAHPGAQHSKTTATASAHAAQKPFTHDKKPVALVLKSHSTLTNVSYSPDSSIIKVWLNKEGEVPHYKSGEKMQINVAASRDCNLMIFDFNGHSSLTQLFPNKYQPKATVKAGETVAIGGDDSAFDYTATLPAGKDSCNDEIFVYAYPTGDSDSAPLSVAMAPTAATFRTANMTPEEYRKFVIKSQSFFARDVKVTPKTGSSQSSTESASLPQAANKYELAFVIEK